MKSWNPRACCLYHVLPFCVCIVQTRRGCSLWQADHQTHLRVGFSSKFLSVLRSRKAQTLSQLAGLHSHSEIYLKNKKGLLSVSCRKRGLMKTNKISLPDFPQSSIWILVGWAAWNKSFVFCWNAETKRCILHPGKKKHGGLRNLPRHSHYACN